MKKYYIFLSVLATATVFVSCQKEDGPTPKGNFIRIASTTVGSHTESRATSVEVYELPSIKTDEMELTITETVTPMDALVSRAGAATLTTLENEGFYIDGFVPYRSDNGNLHFMNNVEVKYNKDVTPAEWQTKDKYNWIDEQDHTFWAHYGTPTDFTSTSPYSTASFTYTNDGREDLMFAYTSQKYSTSQGSTETKIGGLHLTHALAGVTFDLSGVEFYVNVEPDKTKNPNYKPMGTSNRALVSNVSLESYSSAKCMVTNNTTGQYTWSDWANKTSVSAYAPDCTMGFIIPQAKNLGGSATRDVTVGILDKATFTTYMFTIKGVDFSQGAESWIEGNNYTYKLKGKVYLPYAESVLVENVEFKKAKGWNAVKILENVKYLKNFTISWYGSPTGSEGQYAGICMEQTSLSPQLDAYPTTIEGKQYESPQNYYSNGVWNDSFSNLGLTLYVGKQNAISKKGKAGTYEPNESIRIPDTTGGTTYTGKCTATFDVDNLNDPLKLANDPIDIWVVFWAGNNGNAKWNLGKLEITVNEYR